MDYGCKDGFTLMDIQTLKQELVAGKTQHYYVFIGDELAMQDIYIDKIAEVSKLPKVSVSDIHAIYTKLTAPALIKAEPALYVIRNDEEYYKSTAWKKLLKLPNFKGNILVLRYSDVKKSSEFCKAHKELLVSFDLVNSTLLKNRLRATTGLNDACCKELVALSGGNYGCIKNEIYKLQAYARANNYSWMTAYLRGKEAKLFHEEIGDIIFDFTDSIVTRNVKRAYALYPKILKTEDGASLKLISVLYNQFRNILMVQSTPFKERTEQQLGLTKGQIYMTAQKCDHYNLFELVNIVKLLRSLERGIKIGTVEDSFAMEYFMGEIW